MRTRRMPLVGLALFTTFALLVTWMVYNTLRREINGPTYSYSAVFTDVSGMAPGDDVRVAGVRVGRVDKIALDGTSARVFFRVLRSRPLYTNTVASVTYQNIIGQRYLGLAQGWLKTPVTTTAGCRTAGRYPSDERTRRWISPTCSTGSNRCSPNSIPTRWTI